MAEPAAARLAVHHALRSRGFTRDYDAEGRFLYTGRLDPTDMDVPVSIEVDDFDFVALPTIALGSDFDPSGRQLPHVVGPRRALCYYEAGSVILDRYDPAGSVIQCVERAERVLRDASRGRLDPDFADEFGSYWGRRFVYVDIPTGFVGRARMRNARLGRGGREALVVSRGEPWVDPSPRRRRGDDDEHVTVVDVPGPLTLDPDGPWPPRTLSELNTWLEWAAPTLVGEIEKVFAEGSGTTASVVARAPNGMYCYRLTIPEAFRKREFLEVRRAHLLRKLARRDVPVELLVGVRIDVRHVVGRNLGRLMGLAGKRIVLVGCGTIGGFLAHQLALSGAGTQGGTLSLVDPDVMGTGNLGRHVLGVPDLGRNKAEALADFLHGRLPCLAVDVHAAKAQEARLPWPRQHLVIDATGEEALSLALNERAVRNRPDYPDHLFAWLTGNGAAAQCLLTGERGRACLKCLKPRLAGPPRFRTLRPGAEVEMVSTFACGDATHVPFPVSRSVAAAAMACDMVLEWANGNCGKRFRTLTLDAGQAFRVPDGNPGALASCPVCGVDR